MIIGGIATIVWGRARLTQDLDIDITIFVVYKIIPGRPIKFQSTRPYGARLPISRHNKIILKNI